MVNLLWSCFLYNEGIEDGLPYFIGIPSILGFVAWFAMFIYGLDGDGYVKTLFIGGQYTTIVIGGGFYIPSFIVMNLNEVDEQVKQITRILMLSCWVASCYSCNVLS